MLIEGEKTVETMAVPISSSESAVATGYGCKSSVLPLVSPFCGRRCSRVVDIDRLVVCVLSQTTASTWVSLVAQEI